jgi:hypothetical protein
MKTKPILVSVILFLLTSCSASTDLNGGNIDFNKDIESIAEGVARFENNSKNAIDINNQGGDNYAQIVIENKAALDQIENSTEVFLSHINQASSRLPTEDTAESPSKSKLLAWANGYKSWIYYQRLAQEVGEKCLKSEMDFTDCTIVNLPEVLEYERLSRVDLQNAIAGIQEWRNSLGYE